VSGWAGVDDGGVVVGWSDGTATASQWEAARIFWGLSAGQSSQATRGPDSRQRGGGRGEE
jgi:hypothetical protein